jgi:glutathione transport system permease protein
MFAIVLKRLLQAIPTMFLVTVAVFLILHLIPGDPAMQMMDGLDASDIAMVRKQLGLDKPMVVQYVTYMGNILLRGDFGYSFKSRMPVIDLISPRIWPSLQLALAAMLFATSFGIFTGVLAGVRPGGWLDTGVSLISLMGVAVPTFWSGLMLILLFSVSWNLVPSFGIGTWKHLIMPAFTLGAPALAIIARLTRSEMLEVLPREFIRTARSKGLANRQVILKHALRNALLPVLTFVGMQFGVVLGYAVVVESVFAWPGLGRLLVESLSVRDYPMVQGLILLFSCFFIFSNIVVDILNMWLDPRIGIAAGVRQ